MYRAADHHAVEVHTQLWEAEPELPIAVPRDVLERAVECDRLRCLVPAREDALMNQPIHIVGHLVKFWVRLSWIYELAHALQFHADDVELWRRVRERCVGRYVGAAVATGFALAERYFAPCMADEAIDLRREFLAPGIARWIEQCADACVVRQYPGSKLSLLLAREFADRAEWPQIERKWLYPLHRSHRATLTSGKSGERRERGKSMAATARQWRFAASRAWFHATEFVRYKRASRRWIGQQIKAAE
jgi:hypothetical protein